MSQADESPLDLSVVIIAYNESENLKRCLASLPRNSEIIVVDSESEDDTAAIASSFGAKVHDRPFDDFSSQKNFAIDLASRRWILSMDADERCSDKLRETIEKIVKDPSQNQQEYVYTIKRKLVFLGKTLRFGKSSDRPYRLFLKNTARFEGTIHEALKFRCPSKDLPGEAYLEHYSYKDLSDYFARFNRYTTAIAQQALAKNKRPRSNLAHWLRPHFEFFNRYFLRLGILDGYPGYTYALISSLYAYIKIAKTKELLELSQKKEGSS